jgi:hypothetical protein
LILVAIHPNPKGESAIARKQKRGKRPSFVQPLCGR